MKEFILAWKEFKEDQDVRFKAMHQDPEYSEIFKSYGSIYFNYNYFVMRLNSKYGVKTVSFENFLDWLGDGKKKFEGVIIKHEVKDESNGK